MTVSGRYWAPGSAVSVSWGPSAELIGSTTPRSDSTFSLAARIPSSAETGRDHTGDVVATQRSVQTSFSFAVDSPHDPPPSSATGTSSGESSTIRLLLRVRPQRPETRRVQASHRRRSRRKRQATGARHNRHRRPGHLGRPNRPAPTPGAVRKAPTSSCRRRVVQRRGLAHRQRGAAPRSRRRGRLPRSRRHHRRRLPVRRLRPATSRRRAPATRKPRSPAIRPVSVASGRWRGVCRASWCWCSRRVPCSFRRPQVGGAGGPLPLPRRKRVEPGRRASNWTRT